MDADRASLTALATALIRAVHRRRDEPILVDDPYADGLLTPAERDLLLERLLLTLGPEQRTEIGTIRDRAYALEQAVRATPAYAGVLVRARWAEERLRAAVARGVRQYVLLGAGMDTFAFRCPELARELEVFEIDHAATQSLKRTRLARAGLTRPRNLHFLAADLERDSLAEVLARSVYLPRESSFFAWLGVTPYLTRETNLDTLRMIAGCAPAGSEVVFDYLDLDAFSTRASEEARRMVAERAATAEPWVSGFEPARLGRDLADCGLALIEDLDAAATQARYLAARGDELRLVRHAHLVHARVCAAGEVA